MAGLKWQLAVRCAFGALRIIETRGLIAAEETCTEKQTKKEARHSDSIASTREINF
jgi:hypothetical protein